MRKLLKTNIVYLFLIAMVSAAFLSACGGSSSSSDANNTTPQAKNNAPVAENLSLQTNEDLAADGQLKASDQDGDVVTFSVVANPQHGTVVINDPGSGEFTYTPDKDFYGSDSFTYKASDGKSDSNVATVSITVNSVNDLPQNVDAGNDQTVNEGDLVDLQGSGDDVEDGSNVSFQWSQTAGSPTATILNADSKDASFTAPEVAAATVLTFTLTVTDQDGGQTTDTVDITINNKAAIAASVDVSPVNSKDLTALGKNDWLHMGRDNSASVERKNIATPIIGEPGKVDNGNGVLDGPSRFEDDFVGYTWSDGQGGDVQSDPTMTGIFYSMHYDISEDRIGQGYQMEIDAKTTPQTLVLFIGGYQAEGTLTVTLSDDPGNAEQIVLQGEKGIFRRQVTITFKSASAGSKLKIEYLLTDDFDTDSYLSFQAAALSNVAMPVITPAGGKVTTADNIEISTPTPGAEIRYTLDGSEPTKDSNLYSGPFSLDSGTVTVKAKAFLDSDESLIANADFETVAPTDDVFTVSVTTPETDNDLVPVAQVDLTDEGLVDWMAYGHESDGDIDRKAGVTAQISELIKIVNSNGLPGGPYDFNDGPVQYFWNDGNHEQEAEGTNTGVLYSMGNPTPDFHLGQGYTFEVQSTTEMRTLKIYLGGWQALANLHLEMGAQSYDIQFGNQFAVFTREVTVRFKNQSGTPLYISYSLADDYDTQSNLTFQAATLR